MFVKRIILFLVVILFLFGCVEEKSKVNDLKKIEMTTKDGESVVFEPEFNPAITDYKSFVETNIDTVYIKTELMDSKAKYVRNSDKYSLNVGSNSFQIIVESESGSQKMYVIDIEREEPDTIKPELNLNGEVEITLEYGVKYIEPGATALDNKDGDIADKIVVTGSVDENKAGLYIIKYEVSDLAGNKSTLERKITVKEKPDTIKPELSLIGKVEITLDYGVKYIEKGATATDNKDGDITNKIVLTGSVNEKKAGLYVIKYVISDIAGNKSTLERKITVKEEPDTTKPILKLIGEVEIILDYGVKYVEKGATATDNKDGDITDKIVVSGSVNANKAGLYIIKYEVSDIVGNISTMERKITVKEEPDTIKPELKLNGEAEITLEYGVKYVEKGATATDNIDGDITKKIVITGSVDENIADLYIIKYVISDFAGNKTTLERKITVKPKETNTDTIKPELKLNGESEIVLEIDNEYVEKGATATDNVDGDLSKEIEITGNVDISKIGTYIITYSVKDSSDNLATIERKVIVKDSNSENNDVPEGFIRIHYKRYSDDYAGWGLHLWNDNDKTPAFDLSVAWGAPVEFDKTDDWGVYVDVKVIDIKNGLNFIPHKGDVKDVNEDRTFPISGEREFWLIESKPEVMLEEVKVLVEFLNVTFLSGTELMCLLNAPNDKITKEEIIITDTKGNNVEIEDLNVTNMEVVVTIPSGYEKEVITVKYNDSEITPKYSVEFLDENFLYNEDDLGVTLNSDGTAMIKMWSPPAKMVSVILYDKDNQNEVLKNSIEMEKDETGTWSILLDSENTDLSDLNGYYYQFRVNIYGQENICLDPYAKSMAAFDNGSSDKVGKAAIINPSDIGPTLDFANIEGYEKREDAIIWEIHVRDFTSDPSIANGDTINGKRWGTFSAFIEKLDYIKSLGVTHVQLLPVMAWYFGNEKAMNEREMDYSAAGNSFNWGYDPHGFFSPDGAYSEDPDDPELRIKELKELIGAIHDNGMGVILDVVYNHTAQISILENLLPGYYHFMMKNGESKSAYGGGRVGTTHEMSRKLVVDSVKYWVDEFKVDGFRYDLMGEIDSKTIQTAFNEAKDLNPNMLMLGEGWGGDPNDEGDSNQGADQGWMNRTSSAGCFSDEFRNELKSGFGSEGQPRFITGGARSISTIFNNIKGQPSNMKEDDPGDVVQYIAAHDNLTLHDVISQSIKKSVAENEEEIQKRIRIGNSIILTSQGIAFLHAGQEYGRTKQWKSSKTPEDKETVVEETGETFIHDSYDSSDIINMMDWEKMTSEGIHKETADFTRGLIELRRSTDAFRLGEQGLVNSNVKLIKSESIKTTDLVIGYTAISTTDEKYYVFINADNDVREIVLDEDITSGTIIVDSNEAGTEEVKDLTGVLLSEDKITLNPLTVCIIKM